MKLLNSQGVEVKTGDVLHGKVQYVFLGHDGKMINIQTMDERRLYSWVDPSRFKLYFREGE
jgi:hypothetical protein